MDQDGVQQHSYGLTGVLRSFLNSLGAFLLIGIVLLMVKQTWAFVPNRATTLLSILGLALILIAFLIGWLALWYMFPTVQTSANGMRVRVFSFWWVFIPWGDIINLYRWNAARKRIVIVVVNRLTPFHVLYGAMYAETLKPSFLISASIANYDELIKTIEFRTGKRFTT